MDSLVIFMDPLLDEEIFNLLRGMLTLMTEFERPEQGCSGRICVWHRYVGDCFPGITHLAPPWNPSLPLYGRINSPVW